MPKALSNNALDHGIDYVADNGNKLFLCSAFPTSYAEASSTYRLVEHDLTVGPGNGDFTIADNETGGRKLTVAQQALMPIAADGLAQYAAICDSVGSEVLAITTCAQQQLTAGGQVTTPAFAIRYPDPV